MVVVITCSKHRYDIMIKGNGKKLVSGGEGKGVRVWASVRESVRGGV